MVYGYARVSTRSQATDGNGLEVQKELLMKNGVEENNIYAEFYTGTTKDRPKFNELMSVLADGDTLVVCKLDRIARSATQGIEIVNELNNRNITVNILNMGVLDNSTTGKLIRNIFFCFAEFERDMIIERTREGKEKARQRDGYREGRRPKYDKHFRAHACELLKINSYSQVAKMLNVSKSTLERFRKEELEDIEKYQE